MISIDTMKPAVAEAALKAGATIVNDIRGLQGDPEHGAARGRVRRGRDRDAQSRSARLGDSDRRRSGRGVPQLFRAKHRDRAPAPAFRRTGSCSTRGSASANRRSRIWSSSRAFPSLHRLGFPLLAGTSRKSFIGRVTGREAPDRLDRHARHQRRRRARRRGDHPCPRRRRACRGDDDGGGDPRGGRCVSRQRRMTGAVLGLGGNIGDSRKLIAAAIERLAAHPEIDGRGGFRALSDAALGKDRPAAIPERRRPHRDVASRRARSSTPSSTWSATSAASGSSAGDRARSTSTSCSSGRRDRRAVAAHPASAADGARLRAHAADRCHAGCGDRGTAGEGVAEARRFHRHAAHRRAGLARSWRTERLNHAFVFDVGVASDRLACLRARRPPSPAATAPPPRSSLASAKSLSVMPFAEWVLSCTSTQA